ncbi:acyltransferase family protein [Nitrospirillum bahiense]|uniref:Peptidoglycan/LPS O-acetylase OafA/YrhL n=1 Tax=Nitrospirillum amazonense TaxID=28077 RepID=A0A560FXG2_9PROT|nr:acyltransferase family protein [Nitrospirillum amazonense]TWB26326.1 peptidoglycan/LPS O-acetylase OafA/YrhL [Nitrospirillum amazonense]
MRANMEDETRPGSRNFTFLEGIRGLGCIQVALNHYLSAFLPPLAHVPGLPHFNWEMPLASSKAFALVNGTVTVFLFFQISAFVLAQSYLKSDQTISQQILRRFVRLFLPTACSILLAIMLLALLPQPRAWVAPYAQSLWAQRLYVNPMTLISLTRDTLMDSMLIGYRGASLFDASDPSGVFISRLNMSMNPPLWTLHAEFWGSLLVLLLAYLYRLLPRRWFCAVFCALLLVTGTSHFTLFLLGFAAYLGRGWLLTRRGHAATVAGITLVTMGLLIAGLPNPLSFDQLLQVTRHIGLLHAAAGVRLQAEVAAVLVMAGIMVLPSLQRKLSVPWVVWLGRCSFSLYLVHFPLLFTVGFAIFSLFHRYLPYGITFIVTTVLGGGLSVVVAKLFEIYIDRPSLRLSRRLGVRTSLPPAIAETLDVELLPK